MATDTMLADAENQVQAAYATDPDLAREIISSEAFDALAWWLFQVGRDLTDILVGLDPDTKRFVAVAKDPALFLASQIAERL